MSFKILIVEDDSLVWLMLTKYFLEEGYFVQRASGAKKGLSAFENYNPHLLILDLSVTDQNTVELCKVIRKRSFIPILIIDINKNVHERIAFLSAGADAHVSKPFSNRELVAIVAALLRRAYVYFSPYETEVGINSKPEIEYIVLNYESRILCVNSSDVDVTYSEFEIMKLFVANKKRVLSRYAIMNALRGTHSSMNHRSIDAHIANLRKKIELDPKNPKIIKTVWGIGYLFMGGSIT